MLKKALLAAACAAILPAFAAYPERPIQIIVPYSPGGGSDLALRLFGETVKKHYPGTNVVIRNQPGGGGSIGTSAAINARPDGYTLGTGAQGPLVIKPLIGGTDYKHDSPAYIGLFARSLQVLAACKDAPFKTYDEFIAYGKEKPVQVANSGAGGANHVSAEAFALAAGIKIDSVPFDGAADARTACIGGHVQTLVASPAEVKSAAEAGQMQPLFVMEAERIADFPDVPTAVEKGVDFTWSSWKGIIAPQKLPPDTAAWLEKAVETVANDADFKTKMTEMGDFPTYENAADFKARVDKDEQTTRAVLEKLGMLNMNN